MSKSLRKIRVLAFLIILGGGIASFPQAGYATDETPSCTLTAGCSTSCNGTQCGGSAAEEPCESNVKFCCSCDTGVAKCYCEDSQ